MVWSCAEDSGWLRLPLNSVWSRKITVSYISSIFKIKKVLGVEQMPANAMECLKVTFGSFI